MAGLHSAQPSESSTSPPLFNQEQSGYIWFGAETKTRPASHVIAPRSLIRSHDENRPYLCLDLFACVRAQRRCRGWRRAAVVATRRRRRDRALARRPFCASRRTLGLELREA